MSRISPTTSNCTVDLTTELQALSSALPNASQSTLGNIERRHRDWFDDDATDIRSLIHDIYTSQNALLRNSTSLTLYDRFSSICATVQRKLRWMENNWLSQNAAEKQYHASINDAKNIPEALRGVHGPTPSPCIMSEALMAP